MISFPCSKRRRLELISSLLLPRSIIQRAGIVPLSVAGVFKEVTTISIASWAFGDELTPVNFAGEFSLLLRTMAFDASLELTLFLPLQVSSLR